LGTEGVINRSIGNNCDTVTNTHLSGMF